MKTSMVELEAKGRILIPKLFRTELKLKPGQKLLIEKKDTEMVLKPATNLDEFISGLKGCIKKPRIKPKEIKKIWKG